MRRFSFVLGLLLLPIPVCAESQTDTVQIRVRNLTLSGAAHLSQAEQQQIAHDIEKQTYTDSTVWEIPERLRSALMQRGFFQASAPAPDVTIVSSKPGEEVIDMAYRIQEGPQYRLRQITFSSNRQSASLVLPDQELRQTFAIADGAIFNTEAIRFGLQKLRELYASKGYANCIPVPDIQTGDAATVTVNIVLDEGAVYRVGALLLDGVEPVRGAGAKLLESWKQYQGHVYNGTMEVEFMRANAAYLTPSAFLTVFSDHEHLLNFRLSFQGPSASNQPN